ncbi:MAG: hypothetical protein WD648_01770 [Planctomycetaceae bacterium]
MSNWQRRTLRNIAFSMTLFFSLIPACQRENRAADATIAIGSPMPPPAWALLERELLKANAEACRQYFAKYFDDRGWLLCVERWGGDDGPDDAIENCNDWPILHALGAHDDVLAMYKKAWEGHLRQFTLAKTVDVPFARDGMYYKEFPVTFDWLHNGEGLTVFNLQGLSDAENRNFQKRVRRYAGFYMNEDPGAPNYDAEHRIIRSLFNGSRGPLLRKATGLDWAGDPIDVANRFHLGHGEQTYDQMIAHFKDYNDIVGDNPLNLLATSLAMNAYMLTGEKKYRAWLLEYVDAWRERMIANGNIIPSNVGLDGKIGSAAGGKWYGGVYGWGFTVVVPQDGKLAHRNHHESGFVGFMNAYMLTHDDGLLDVWRKQADTINAQSKTVDGREAYPTMFGDKGWYAYEPGRYTHNALELYYLSMKPDDKQRVPENAWLAYLDGNNPGYPEQVLLADFERIRQRNQAMREDTSTPDTRLADDPMDKNPASVSSLIPLMLGGLHPGHRGAILNARVRYFDPIGRRAGLPDDVAALVEELNPEGIVLTLVNTNPLVERAVIVQAGGYAEHQFTAAQVGQQSVAIDDSHVTVKLAPGAGNRLFLTMQRYANQPTMAFPWDR